MFFLFFEVLQTKISNPDHVTTMIEGLTLSTKHMNHASPETEALHHARHGTAPYPRPQNVWIHCNTADLNDSFSDLRLKVTKPVLLLDSND